MAKIKCSDCGHTQDSEFMNCTKCGAEMPSVENSGKLINKDWPAQEIMKISCSGCGSEEPPKRWLGRIIFGVLLLFLGIIPCIIFFIITNPYICPNCQKREYLTKILNNGNTYEVQSKSVATFTIISILTLLFLLLIFSLGKT